MLPADVDDAQFRSAFTTHYDALARYCLRRLPRHDVDDAVARVFTVAWRKVDEMPSEEATLPWLYRIASYEVATMRRSQRRHGFLRSKLNGLAVPDQMAPEAQVVRSAEHESVLVALASMAPSDREVILLRSYEDLSADEIAAVLGCTPEAARKRLSRALKRLRKAAGIPQPRPPRGEHDVVAGGER